MKSKLCVFISAIMAFAIVFSACGEEREYDGEDIGSGAARNITSNFAEDSSTGFIVQWHNGTETPEQFLQIVKAADDFNDEEKIEASYRAWFPTKTPANRSVGAYQSRNVYRVEVTGLEPDTNYKYRVGNPDNWSTTFHHTTSKGSMANFSFTVGADTQDNVFNQMKATFNAANTFDSDNRFFIIAGDISDYPQENINEFPNFLKAANELSVRKPIVATQGNHDTYLVNASNRDGYVFGNAEVFNSFITFPDNGWARKQGQTNASPHRSDSYYFYYNEVLFIMLNTMATQNATGASEPNHAAQRTWLTNVLQHDKDNSLSKYIIVVTHVTFFDGRGSNRGSPVGSQEGWLIANTRAAYGKIITDFDVDIVFFGHDHVYTRSNPIKFGTYTSLSSMYSSGGFNTVANGTIFSIAGSIGPKIYAFRNHPANPSAAPVASNFNSYIPYSWPVRTDQQSPGMFVNVKVTAAKLEVTARRLNHVANIDHYEVPAKR